MAFNSAERTKNAMRISVWGGVTNGTNVVLRFIARSVFILVLTKEYLGLIGLFTNLVALFALSEMGFAIAITYRFYEPIANNDVRAVGQLMNFFRTVYRYIALFIAGVGLLFLPFVKYLFKASENIPTDVNLTAIYLMYVLSTVVTYLYSYKQTMLLADQRTYVVSIAGCIFTAVNSILKIAVLLWLRDFMIYLAVDIVTTVLYNIVLSTIVDRQYPEVFAVKEKLPKDQARAILHDTKACMYHKVGAKVLESTDNLVVTKIIGLAATGILVNYATLITIVRYFLDATIGSQAATIGNARTEMSRENFFRLYKKMNFMTLWVSVVFAGCIGICINDFINLWIGETYLFGPATVALLCVNFFAIMSRATTNSFTEATGLFVKDRFRPLIEAAINLVVSIIAARMIGVAGVFLGTFISYLVTVAWRGPLILFRYEFRRSTLDYWKMRLTFVAIGLGSVAALLAAKEHFGITINGWLGWAAEGVIVFVALNLVLVLLLHRWEEFGFMMDKVQRMLRRSTA